jgi:hypothetical protein
LSIVLCRLYVSPEVQNFFFFFFFFLIFFLQKLAELQKSVSGPAPPEPLLPLGWHDTKKSQTKTKE